MPHVTHNRNGKIWVYTNSRYGIIVLGNTKQQITFKIHEQQPISIYHAFMVYDKYDN